MASAAQIAANRRNALKSTGPRTARGKAVVRCNALKHGLRSQTTLVPGEDADQFLALVALFRAEHQPADSLQEACVLLLASAVWKINRADKLENQAVAQASNDIIESLICKIDVLTRYRTTALRWFFQALQRLEALKARFSKQTRFLRHGSRDPGACRGDTFDRAELEAFCRLGSFLAGSPLLLRSQQRPPDPRDRVPGLDEIGNVFDFEPIARGKMTRNAYDYIVGGVDGEFTLRRNRQAFDWAKLIPRAVADVGSLDLSTELLGQKLSCPILVAPSAAHQQVNPEGELATHQGATAANALMVVSSNASYPIDKISASAKGPLWFQLYARDTPEGTRERVERAQEAGCRAVCLTVDVQYYSHRERLLHNRNLSTAVPGAPVRSRRQAAPEPAPHPYRLRGQNPELSWATVETLRSYTKVPLLLKGILTAEDAKLAIERGVDGIVVSNHGARYLDYAPATFEVLPEIVEAVRGRMPVLIDGGFRRGTDILKALALGANAVLVGRAPLWGLGAFGAAGVQRVLEILQAELAIAMADTGNTKVVSINRSSVAVDFP